MPPGEAPAPGSPLAVAVSAGGILPQLPEILQVLVQGIRVLRAIDQRAR